MYLIQLHEPYQMLSGAMYGYQWKNGFTLCDVLADYDFLVEKAGCKDMTPGTHPLFGIWGETKKILVVRHGGWGDMAMLTPLLRALDAFFPGSQITVAGRSPEINYLKGNPLVHQVFDRPISELPYFSKEYDQWLDLTWSVEMNSHAEFENCYRWICERFGLHDAVPDDDFDPDYYVLERERLQAEDILRNQVGLKPGEKLITFHPEASSNLRTLPTQTAVKVARMLAEQGPAKVIYISKNHLAKTQVETHCRKCKKASWYCVTDVVDSVKIECRNCRELMTVKWKPLHKNVFFTAGELSFRDIAAIIERADVHVGVDSSFSHVAGSRQMKKKQVGLYASFDGQLRMGFMSNATIFQLPYSCSPCNLHRPRCGFMGEENILDVAPCMQSFSPEEIVRVTLEAMEEKIPKEGRGTPNIVGKVHEIDYYRRNCPVCDTWPEDKEKQAVARKAGFSYWKCGNCGVVYSGKLADVGNLACYDGPEYYDVYTEKRLRRELYRMGQSVIDAFWEFTGKRKKKGLRVLDIGSGTGSFLKPFLDAGWDVYGIEINPAGAEITKRDFGIDSIITANIDDVHLINYSQGKIFHQNEISRPPIKSRTGKVLREAQKVGSQWLVERDSFDLIISSHTIEHVGRPLDLFRKIRNLLKPGGLFFAYAPSAELCEQKSGFVQSLHLTTHEGGEHTWLPSRPSLEFLGRKTEMTMIYFEFLETAESFLAWFRRPTEAGDRVPRKKPKGRANSRKKGKKTAPVK